MPFSRNLQTRLRALSVRGGLVGFVISLLGQIDHGANASQSKFVRRPFRSHCP